MVLCILLKGHANPLTFEATGDDSMEIPRDEVRQCHDKQRQQVAGPYDGAARSVSHAYFCFTIIVLRVVWTTRREILPGWAFIGAVIPAVLWACLHAGL